MRVRSSPSMSSFLGGKTMWLLIPVTPDFANNSSILSSNSWHQIVVGEGDDEDFLDGGHGDAGEDPTKHDARAGEEGKCAEDEHRDKRDYWRTSFHFVDSDGGVERW